MIEQQPTVQSVARTFMILEDLCANAKGLTIKEITEKTKLSKSTVHRLLENLIILGYAMQSKSDDRYHATLKMFEIGSETIGNIDMVSVIRPFLNKLAYEVGETVHLVMQNDASVVYLMKAEAGHLGMSSRIGSKLPMYCSGTGKAILAQQSEKEVEEVWKKSKVKKLTPKTIETLDELKVQLSQIKKRDWAFDDEENEIGICCVATALPQINGVPPLAFSISSLKAVMDDAHLQFLVKQCLKVKKEIIREIGFF